MMKIILKIFAAICVIAMMIAGKGRDASKKRDQMPHMEQKDTTDKCDTFVPLHPPVVVPHTWREAK